jgi:hypothetical protein
MNTRIDFRSTSNARHSGIEQRFPRIAKPRPINENTTPFETVLMIEVLALQQPDR